MKTLTIIALLCLLIAHASPCFGQSKYDSSWQEILALAPDSTQPKMNTVEKWVEISSSASKIFRTNCAKSSEIDAWIDYYIDRFGKSGDEADLRWLAACPHYLLPTPGRPAYAPADPNWVKEDAKLRGIKVCKTHAAKLLSDTQHLERYYRALIWSRHFFGKNSHVYFDIHKHSLSKYTKKEFKKTDDDFWWHCRNMILLLRSTNRLDLIDKDIPERTLHSFQEWAKWIDSNRTRLSLHKDGISWSLPDNTRHLGKKAELPNLHAELPFEDYHPDITPSELIDIRDYITR